MVARPISIQVRRHRRYGSYVALLLACMLLCLSQAWADDVSVSASLDRDTVGVGEQVQLTVQVSGAQTQEAPQLPNLAGLDAVSAGQSTNVQMVNGQVSQSTGFIYLLTPRHEGHFTIGRITVSANGRTYQTEPLELEVTAASAAPPQAPNPVGPPGFPQFDPFGMPRPPVHFRNPPGVRRIPLSGLKPLYLTATVDHKVAYPGEKVTYTFRFYRLAQVAVAGSPRYTPPDTTGFVTDDQRPQRSFQETIKGHTYAVTELRTSLYPTAPGHYQIGAAKLSCRVADLFPNLDEDDAIGLMQQLSLGEERELTAPAVPVEVRALPAAGRPASFSGAVGHFKMTAHLDHAKANVGEAVNLVMEVSGDGNLSLATPPKLPTLGGFKAYDTVTSGKDTGKRTYTTVLVPTEPGTRRIEGLKYSWFDADAGKYVETTAAPLPLEVTGSPMAATATPAGGNTGSAASSSGASGASAPLASPGMSSAAPDALRYIHTEASLHAPTSLLDSRWFIALQGLPLMLLAGTLLAGAWQRWRHAVPTPERRRQGALRRARAQLRSRGAEQAPQVLHDFLEDRLAVHTAGLSLRELDALLGERGAPAEVRQNLRAVLESADAARYGGAKAPGTQDIGDLLNGLEASLR
jgi:hypothetical protein